MLYAIVNCVCMHNYVDGSWCILHSCCLFRIAQLSCLYAACRYVANADRLGAVVMERRNRADSLDDEDDEPRDYIYS